MIECCFIGQKALSTFALMSPLQSGWFVRKGITLRMLFADLSGWP